MSAYQTADKIVRYFAETKGVGHSRAVVDGAAACRANIVVADSDKHKRLGNVLGRKVLCLSDVESGDLDSPGIKPLPLVLDNGAVKALLIGLLDEIDNEKSKSASLQAQLEARPAKTRKAKDTDGGPAHQDA